MEHEGIVATMGERVLVQPREELAPLPEQALAVLGDARLQDLVPTSDLAISGEPVGLAVDRPGDRASFRLDGVAELGGKGAMGPIRDTTGRIRLDGVAELG